MMKNLKKFKIICLILAVFMVASTTSVWAVEDKDNGNTNNVFHVDSASRLTIDEGSQTEKLGLIQATATSAIDGSPFYAYYDPETGKVSSVSMDGESMGYRYVDSEEAFWELVEFNAEVTSQTFEQRMDSDSVNRNNYLPDGESRIQVEYDEYGNRIITYLDDDANDKNAEASLDSSTIGQIFPNDSNSDSFSTYAFDTNWLYMFVPFAYEPSISGALVGDTYHSSSDATHIVLETGSLPYGSVVDVLFRNGWGDDESKVWNIGSYSTGRHYVRFPGEWYGAFASLYNNTQTSHYISLKFYTEPLQQSTSLTLQYNGNGHTSGSPPTSHSINIPGSITLKDPGSMSKSGYTFVGWQVPSSWGMPSSVYPAGTTINFPSGFAGTYTLYAQWNSAPFGLTVNVKNSNGNSISSATVEVIVEGIGLYSIGIYSGPQNQDTKSK